MARVTKLQRLLLGHIEAMGGKHVYISRAFVPPAGSGLHGFTWEGVSISLNSLVRRGMLRAVKGNFFYLASPGAGRNS